MKKDQLTNTLGLYVLGAIAAAGLVGYFVIAPQYSEAQKLRASVAIEKRKIGDLHKLDTDTTELRQNYEKISTDEKRILAVLPRVNEQENLLSLVSKLAQENGVILSVYTPEVESLQAEAKSTIISPMPVSINVTGTFATVQKFMDRLENAGRYIETKSGTYASGGTKNGTIIQLRLALTAYYQNDAKVTPVAPVGVSK